MLTVSLAIGVSGISGSAPRVSGFPESGDHDFSAWSSTSGDVARSVTLAGRGAVQVRARLVFASAPKARELSQAPRPAASEHCRSARTALRRTIADRRAATRRWQDALGYPHTRTAFRERTAIGCRYLVFLRRLWTLRADEAWRKWVSLRDPRAAIEHVFGLYASEALEVSSCETGGTFDTKATNGQYVNIFQMGYSERQRYGWHVAGSPALVAARAAWRYFVASGRDWSPWSCRPR